MRPAAKLATLLRPAMLMLLAAGSSLAVASDDAQLKAAIASPARETANVARDGARHPYETLRFFGIRPDMTVVEIWPGGGWYTEILAPYLHDRGTFYAAHFDPDGEAAYYRDSLKKFETRLAADPARYGKVKLTRFDPPKVVDIAPPGSADLVLTFRNVHNWYMRGGGDAKLDAAFGAMYRALKPGGVLGVVDHRLPPALGAQAQEASGYMLEDVVIGAAQRAGFRLAARSEINANPKDKADHPNGVWSLPPSLRVDEVQRAQYQAIGESDRMTLKFVKPAK